MNWGGRRVLVTGAGGFIGSHLVEELVRQGAEVVAFVRYTSQGGDGLLSTVAREVQEQVRIIRGDVRDAEAVEEAVRGREYVFHLAALVGVPYSFLHPNEVIAVNTLGTLNLLNAARTHEVQRVIVTSTSEVYGTACHVPMGETHPLQAQSPYAASKIAADAIAVSFHRAYRLPVGIIRPFNTYGPRQSARAVIPTIITQALNGREVRLGNLDATRDFTYVGDTVGGFLAVAGAPPEALGQPINVGSGTEISIRDLATKILALTGSKATITVDPERLRPPAGEVERLCADTSRARALLGWAPRVAIDEGLRRTSDWMARYLDRYRPERYAV